MLHILLGNAAGDTRTILRIKDKHARLDWIVPKKARIGDPVVFFLRREGFVARGTVSSSPSLKGPREYRAIVSDVALVPAFVPLGYIQTKLPDWKWTRYPRGYASVGVSIEKQLDQLLRRYKQDNPDKERDEIGRSANISQERAAGFQSSPEIRAAVEKFAMAKARSILAARGYKNFKNTANSKSYDYSCQKRGRDFFIEVKGTQTLGKAVILTRSEVKHIVSHPKQCILVLVHSVQVSKNGGVKASGGITKVNERWAIRRTDLSPIQYLWTVN